MQRLKAAPARYQPAHQQGRLAGQHRGARLSSAVTQRLNGLVHEIQPLTDRACQDASCTIEKNPLPSPLEQWHAQVVFQQPHGAANGAVGQMQFLRRLAEILQARSRFEATQRHERR